MTHVSRAQEIVRELLNTDQGTLSHVTREDLEELALHLQGARERAPKRENYIAHWGTVIDIVEYGLEADTVKLRAYAELLLQKLEEDRQDLIADSLRRALKRGGRGKGNLIYPASVDNTSEGTLLIREDHLFLCVDSPALPPPVPVEPGTRLAIHLGTHWIEGVFQPEVDETSGQMEPFDLLCGASFCGLRSGMRACLCNKSSGEGVQR